MANVRQLYLGAAGDRREIQAGAWSLSGGNYFRLDQG